MDLTTILDFEIWKASNMLFQPIPYQINDTEKTYENHLFKPDEAKWDDTWHGKFKEEGRVKIITTEK